MSPERRTPFQRLHAPRDGYVFIVTYGRSGSTLLQNVLNAIDGWCIRGENNNTLFHLFRAWHAVAESAPMQGLRGAAVETGANHPWYGAELGKPWQYGQALCNVFARDVLQLPEGTRVGGFKEIRFHSEPGLFLPYLNFVQRNFPRARFVFNTRDHAAVARSGWWRDLPGIEVDRRLTEAETLFARFQAQHPTLCHPVHYDAYNGNPEGLRPLFEFIGEPFDVDLIAPVMAERLGHLKDAETQGASGADGG